MKVTPNIVSARVVKMVNFTSLSFTENTTSVPSEQPIQFFWVSFDTVAPLDGLQTVEQSLRVSRCSQAPLLHLLLDDRITATLTYAVYYLVVGKHSTQTWAPVYHRFAEVSDAVVHQNLLLLHVVVAVPLLGCEVNLLVLSHVQVSRTLLLEALDELLDRLSLLAAVAEE